MEYAVVASHRFLAAAPDGAVDVTYMDPEMGSNTLGVLVLLTSTVLRKFDGISIFKIICGYIFGGVASFDVCSLASKVYWT